MVASLAWGGYANGYIPDAAMAPIGGGFLLEAGAARQFLAAATELQRDYGINVVAYVSETYRDFAGQVYQRARWTALGQPNNAAIPGSSIHGWAKAIDFNADALQRDGIYDIVMAVLEKYGFIRDVSGESWHVSFREAQVAAWASDSITPFEEDDMFSNDDRAVLEGLAWTLGQVKGQTDKLGRIAVASDLVLWATTDPSQGLRRMVANLSDLAVKLDSDNLTKEQAEEALKEALAPFTATTIADQQAAAEKRVADAAVAVAAVDAPTPAH